MTNAKCTIIIPTNSDYLDVCNNFLAVLKRNWGDCKLNIVLSVYGKKDVSISEYNYLYNGEESTLPECILRAAKRYPSKCYMIFLGDAFICKEVSDNVVEKLIDYFISKKLSYCNLRPKQPLEKEKKINNYIRYINVRDRYSHSFISFLASNEFLSNEFNKKEKFTDIDFELKYLNLVNTSDKNYYFNNHVILKEDIFGIRPGIEKGMWNRLVLNYLKKRYQDIEFCNRELISIRWQIVLLVSDFVTPYISNKFRRKIKQALVSRIKGKKFNTTT